MGDSPACRCLCCLTVRTVEVASVSDAMEQLYAERAYMSHDMRPFSDEVRRPGSHDET